MTMRLLSARGHQHCQVLLLLAVVSEVLLITAALALRASSGSSVRAQSSPLGPTTSRYVSKSGDGAFPNRF